MLWEGRSLEHGLPRLVDVLIDVGNGANQVAAELLCPTGGETIEQRESNRRVDLEAADH